jgi:hypothetical protein
MNCDTRLAINLRMFKLGENDEFIFTIKNYNYIDSPYVFLFRARSTDINEDGEVLFKITPAESKHIKPGAFYNFAILHNAFDPRQATEYQKLTENGNIIIEYGAQDLAEWPERADDQDDEIIGVRLEPVKDMPTFESNKFMGEIVGVRLDAADS